MNVYSSDVDPSDFDADPDPMDPDFQRRCGSGCGSRQFVYMTMAFFSRLSLL